MVETIIEKLNDFEAELSKAEDSLTAERFSTGEINELKKATSNFKSYIQNAPRQNELEKKQEKWAELSIEQLSFFNNLLIVLGTGFLGLAFKGLSFSKYVISIHFENVPTFTMFSLLFMALSVTINLLCSFNRLLVFNHQTHILRLQKRFISENLDLEKSCDVKIKPLINYWIFKPSFYTVIDTDYNNDGSEAKDKLCKMIKLLSSLRNMTTNLLKVGIVSFLLSIFFYVLLILNQ